jgi:hypothetical protein
MYRSSKLEWSKVGLSPLFAGHASKWNGERVFDEFIAIPALCRVFPSNLLSDT